MSDDPFGFFDAIYCINLDTATRRWEQMCRRFQALGIAPRVQRFAAVATPHWHHIGCGLSHRSVVELAHRQGLRNVLVFEDDAIFLDDTRRLLQRSVAELATRDWNLFYLGGCDWGGKAHNVTGCRHLRHPGPLLTCAHAIAYNHTVYETILNDLPDDLDGMAAWIADHRGIDIYIRDLDQRFLTRPSLASQRSILESEDAALRERYTLGDVLPGDVLRLGLEWEVVRTGDRAMLIHRESGQLALNETAAMVVGLLDGERTAAEIRAVLETAWPETAATIGQGVDAILANLVDLGVLIGSLSRSASVCVRQAPAPDEAQAAANVAVVSSERLRFGVFVHPCGRALVAVARGAGRADLDAVDLFVDGRSIRARGRARSLPSGEVATLFTLEDPVLTGWLQHHRELEVTLGIGSALEHLRLGTEPVADLEAAVARAVAPDQPRPGTVAAGQGSLHPVQGVSFPRSGNHFLIDLLVNYFCALEGRPPMMPTGRRHVHIEVGPFSWCEYYGCCRQIPCAHGAVFNRNHDFALELPRLPGTRYLIQFRHPVPAVISAFERIPAKLEWSRFSRRRAQEWNAWMEKWVVGHRDPLALIVYYDDLVRHTRRQMIRILRHFGHDPNPALIPERSHFRRRDLGDHDVDDIIDITRPIREVLGLDDLPSAAPPKRAYSRSGAARRRA